MCRFAEDMSQQTHCNLQSRHIYSRSSVFGYRQNLPFSRISNFQPLHQIIAPFEVVHWFKVTHFNEFNPGCQPFNLQLNSQAFNRHFDITTLNHLRTHSLNILKKTQAMSIFYRRCANVVPHRRKLLSIPPGEASLESCSISAQGYRPWLIN